MSSLLVAEVILGWICHNVDMFLFYRPFSCSEVLCYGNRTWFGYLFRPLTTIGKVSRRCMTSHAAPKQAKCLLRSLTPTASQWSPHASWFPHSNLNGSGGSTSLWNYGSCWPKRSDIALPYITLKEVVDPSGAAAKLADLCVDTRWVRAINALILWRVSIRLSRLNVLKARKKKKKHRKRKDVYYHW